MSTCKALLPLLGMLASASAGFFPPASQAQSTASQFCSEITVSSLETTSLCETTPDVKSYSGYVSTSASLAEIGGLPGYPLNTFYWFFESRNNPSTAPFVLWHGGGPGFTGVASAVFENGPCSVNNDSNSTTLNPYSWTNVANILYIDSPSMVGYSYDILTNATIDGLNASLPIIPANFSSGDVPSGNNTFQVGTFGSQNPLNTANSTGNTSPLVWATLQAWFSQYPQYLPADGKISMWSESYGGHYLPAFATFFNQQNQAIENGSLTIGVPLAVDTVGIVNGYIDPVTQVSAYPSFVNNNTYGLQTVPPEVQASMQQNLTKTGGCLDAVSQCQALTAADPANNAQNTTIDGLCGEAFLLCEETVQGAYNVFSGRSQDDIAHPALDPFPPEFYVGFFNQQWVQAALGSPVNFTANSGASLLNFVESGDGARPGTLAQLAALLDSGTQVALMFGDRDYQLNWVGGDAASLLVDHADAPAFRAAGFANFTASDGAWGGVTRQAGNFSFTRVFQSGHSVPAYQPAVALDIFARAMARTDVATGRIDVTTQDCATQGPADSFVIKNIPPPMRQPVCYTWEIGLTCTPDLQRQLVEGTAVVHNFIATNGTGPAVNGTQLSSSGGGSDVSVPSAAPASATQLSSGSIGGNASVPSASVPSAAASATQLGSGSGGGNASVPSAAPANAAASSAGVGLAQLGSKASGLLAASALLLCGHSIVAFF